MLGLTHCSGFPVHRSSRRGYSSFFHSPEKFLSGSLYNATFTATVLQALEVYLHPLLPAYSRGLQGVRQKVGLAATTPIRAGSSRPTNIQHKFDIPGYGKIDLRIFGDRDLRGDNDVQRPPLAKCIKRSRLARCVKPYCLRPRCLMCVRWPVGTRRKFEGAVELRGSGRAVQVRKLRRQG